MANYLNEIEANSNNLEHLLKLMFVAGLTEEEKNRVCAYVTKAIDLNELDKKIDADGWKNNIKSIMEKYNGAAAEEDPQIKAFKKIIGNIQWHEEQIAYSFGELKKLAAKLLS